MEKVHHQLFDCGLMNVHTSNVYDAGIRISDSRVAMLLLVLNEIDESMQGLENLPMSQLSELVSKAIEACGFTDPIEARSAIARVLQAIELPAKPDVFVS